MGKVIILTDSTCDLTKEIIEERDIRIIPLHVVFGEDSFKDLIEIQTPKLYEEVKNRGMLPKTAAVSPQEIIDFVKPLIDEGNEVFYTGIGSKISSTYQSALIAKEELPEGKFEVSDSLNLSTGIGLLVLKACSFRDQGLSVKDIKKKIDDIVPHVKSQFCIKTLDYLYKGGRCSGMAKVFGTLLRMHPMIVVRDGELKVGKKPIGLMKKAVGIMTDIFMADLENIDPEFVFVTDSSQAEQSYEEISTRFVNDGVYNKVKHIYHTTAGCVISSHCGPGTIGILYIMKEGLNDTILDEEE